MYKPISKYCFLDETDERPKRLIKVDTAILEKYLSPLNIELEVPYYVKEELYKSFETRFFGEKGEFTNNIGRVHYENKVPDIDYKMNRSQFNNVIAIILAHHLWAFDLWKSDYHKNYTKEIIKARKDLKQIADKLKIIDDNFTEDYSGKISIKVNDNKIEINSYLFISSVLHFLGRWVEPEKYKKDLMKNDKIISYYLDIINTEDSKLGAIGKGKNFEIDYMQKFTFSLFEFLKGENVISPMTKTQKLSDRRYYGCISDLYCLVTLPKTGTSWTWDYLDEQYDREIQIDKIELWIQNYIRKEIKKS